MKILSLFYSSYITRNLLDIQYQSIHRYLYLPSNEPCDRVIIHSAPEEIQKKLYLIQPDVSTKERPKPSNWTCAPKSAPALIAPVPRPIGRARASGPVPVQTENPSYSS